MPAYPDRWRVVLADGRVGHRTGEVPPGPWVRLGRGWANPDHLDHQNDSWVDPAGFAYAHEPLSDSPAEITDDEELPVGLLTVENGGKDWFWRTDSGELPCELSLNLLRELYPNLAPVHQKCLVYLPRSYAATLPPLLC